MRKVLLVLSILTVFLALCLPPQVLADTTYLTNVTIDSTGYWQGRAGDVWSISSNFLNYSTQNTLWNTGLSTITLTGSGNQIFNLAGTDQGGSPSGYTNNFAWGTLSITGGGSLTLTANSTSGYAQYVTTISGLTISSGVITNISEAAGSNLNIYYLASNPGNSYLQGLTYNLEGGGKLIPVNPAAVPALGPLAGLLLIVGLTGLAAVRGRIKEKGKTTN